VYFSESSTKFLIFFLLSSGSIVKEEKVEPVQLVIDISQPVEMAGNEGEMQEEEVAGVYYLSVAHSGGKLEIFRLPELQLVFSTFGLCNGNVLLENTLNVGEAERRDVRYIHPMFGRLDASPSADDGADRYVVSMAMTFVEVGERKNIHKLLLSAVMSDGDVQLYWPSSPLMKYTFSKVPHDIICRYEFKVITIMYIVCVLPHRLY
jgi:hypothetical protein